jgi:hypothetical protein
LGEPRAAPLAPSVAVALLEIDPPFRVVAVLAVALPPAPPVVVVVLAVSIPFPEFVEEALLPGPPAVPAAPRVDPLTPEIPRVSV